MIRRWCVYLAVLIVSLGLYVAFPGWITWIAVLTAAGSPLVSVAVSAARKERDALGLFRFPGKRWVEYVRELRPYCPGDPLGRVHWKQKAKTGRLVVWEERVLEVPAPRSRRISGIVPVALCFAVLFCAFPPGKYDQQMRALQGLLQRRQEVRFDLTAGPWTPNKQAVLDVVTSESQWLYLRGQAFDTYDGRSWRASGQDENWPACDAEGAGTVTIATRTVQGLRYFPYYVAGERLELDGGALDNPDGAQEYTYKQQAVGTAGAVPAQYLALPEDTRAWAEGILSELFGQHSLTDREKVERIQNFVRSCARYDTNAVAMPEDADFVRWFIEQSGGGYCVHFASAAAVFLRCAGIPARFVTGYAVQVQAGLRKTVVGDDAHAWVEYLDGGVWRVLEATPTVEAVPLPEKASPAANDKKEDRRLGVGFRVLMGAAIIGVLLWVCIRRGNVRWQDEKLKALAQKAAFSRDGLSEEEKREFVDILAHLRKPKRERKGQKVKQEEKKPITWEVADPKPPVVQSGKMENRKQN